MQVHRSFPPPCRYDLCDVEISPTSILMTPQGTIYATEGVHYITVSVEEVLFEGGRSIRLVWGEGLSGMV